MPCRGMSLCCCSPPQLHLGRASISPKEVTARREATLNCSLIITSSVRALWAGKRRAKVNLPPCR